MTEDLKQGTDEWRQARLGKVTASRIDDVMAKTKTGWGASRGNYLAELVAERLTGVPTEGFKSAAMEWGNQYEADARDLYQFMKGFDVVNVGMIPHPTIADAGASPDGLVGDDGLIEIKCPQTKTHIDTLLSETVPSRYGLQMQWQMACTGRKWCDFMSFDPRLPAEMQMFLTRVPRDEPLIRDLEREIPLFIREVEQTVEKLLAKYGAKAA